MYKLNKNTITNDIDSIICLSDSSFIPISLCNTDYQIFKSKILAGDAELQDSGGVLMTTEESKAYISTLP